MSENLSKKTKQRREMILSAALELFLKNGYENTSLSDIIAISGGSLSSIYRLFGDKEGLFRAITERGINEFVTDVHRKVANLNDSNLKDFLLKFAEAYVENSLKHESLAFKQLIISESFKKNTKIIEIFDECGIKPMHKILTDFFSREDMRIIFEGTDLELAAFRFCLILEEPIAYRVNVLGEKLLESSSEKKAWIKNCVNFFLDGINSNLN